LEILDLHRSGLSQREIARKLGISRNTVKKYVENPESCIKDTGTCERQSILDPYEGAIKAWLDEDEYYKSTWIYDRLVNQGYTGSYETVKRKVGKLKKNKQKIAYMRFETEPGHQAQVDFGEFQIDLPDGSVKKLYLFSMILGYSRKIYTEFIEKCDMPSFLDCHIHAFDYFKGVPDQILYDRMKNVYIAKLAGKHKFNATLIGFALHYGFTPQVAPAYAAWVKGKVERPYTFIREGFWRGYGYLNTARANKDLWSWILKKDERIHGTTHEKVSVRFEREQPHLNLIPYQVFDTSYRIYRKVYKDCTVHFESNRYVLPHPLVGKQVILRMKNDQLRIFENHHLVVVYDIPQTKGNLVQKKRFYEALKKDLDMNRRKYNHSRKKGRAKQTISPTAPGYEMDVEIRSILEYEQFIPEVAL
jgi:transposase